MNRIDPSKLTYERININASKLTVKDLKPAPKAKQELYELLDELRETEWSLDDVRRSVLVSALVSTFAPIPLFVIMPGSLKAEYVSIWLLVGLWLWVWVAEKQLQYYKTDKLMDKVRRKIRSYEE